jgi:hypothetical protein
LLLNDAINSEEYITWTVYGESVWRNDNEDGSTKYAERKPVSVSPSKTPHEMPWDKTRVSAV